MKHLAALGAAITLLTFEKPQFMADRAKVQALRSELKAAGIDWRPLRYHKRPTVPATMFDVLLGIARGLAIGRRKRVQIVHARTIVGGLVGMYLAPLLGAKLIYHNEGNYADEQVDAGLWVAGSPRHRAALALEGRMFGRADSIIVISHRARLEIEALPQVAARKTPAIVVPSVVQVERFPVKAEPSDVRRGLQFIYVGGVGGRFRLDKIARFVAVANEELGNAHLRVLSYVEHEVAAELVHAGCLPDDRWSIDCVPFDAVPTELIKCDVGIHFLPQGRSDHTGSPTKVGEYWAAGLPVVVTPNAGDTQEIIEQEQVGVIVRDHSDDAYRAAVNELKELMGEPELAQRCRRAAETHYSMLSPGERQVALYRRLVTY